MSAKAAAKTNGRGVRKLLIIDDDRELCEELADVFKDKGYKPEIACDPLEGLGMLKKCAYHALILDFKMPHATGIDVLYMLKEAGIKTNTLMITGRPHIEKMLEENGLRAMVRGVLSKPIDVEKMMKMLDEIKG